MGLAVIVSSALTLAITIGPLYRKTNWAPAIDEHAVWINLRNYLSTRLPEAQTVVRIACEEIKSVSRYAILCDAGHFTEGEDSSRGNWAASTETRSRPNRRTLTEAIRQERDVHAPPRKLFGVNMTVTFQGSLVSVPRRGTIRILCVEDWVPI